MATETIGLVIEKIRKIESRAIGAASAGLLLRSAQYLAVRVDLLRERLRKARGDPETIQREIEERAQELARLRWVEEGYGQSQGAPEAGAG